MSKLIKCDICGKIDNPIWFGRIKRRDFNYGDVIKKESYPDSIDLCTECSDELIAVIREMVKKKKEGK